MSTPNDHLERGQAVLEVAALVARLPDNGLRDLHALLAAPGGRDELAELFRRYCALPALRRRAILRGIADAARLRISR